MTISSSRGIEQGALERARTTWPLVLVWTSRDLRVRYRQSVLRSGWSLLQPVAILLTYGWVFTSVLDIVPEDVPFLTLAWAGLVPYTFFSQSLAQGVGSIQQSSSIISRVYFPREVLPLAVVGGAAVDLAITTATLFVVVWVQVGPPSIHALGLLPVYLLLFVWTIAVTVAGAAVTVFRRDLNFAVPLALRVLFIVTPVVYSASLIEAQAPWLLKVNPLAVVIEGTRDAMYRSQWPDATVISVQMAIGLVLLVAVFRLFRRLEPRMSDVA